MPEPVLVAFAAVEILYLGCLLVTLWLYSRRVDLVVPGGEPTPFSTVECVPNTRPEVIVLYPSP